MADKMVSWLGLGSLLFFSQLLNPNPLTIKHRGMWVRAMSIAYPQDIPRIMEIARKLEVTDLYVQVVISGYAYYKSCLLPRSEYLAKASGPDYDPLDTLLKVGHKDNLRVHAWVNTCLAWSLEKLPDSTNHIIYIHPEWFLRDVQGRSMVDYTYEDWKNFGLEGLFLDPAHDGVNEYLTKICSEIVEKYPVDGIHLDFIRYPGVLWGLPNNDEAAIFAGLEADTVRWLSLTRYPRLPFSKRWIAWHLWRLNKARERGLFCVVQAIHNAVKQNAMKNTCVVSTAVVANSSRARYQYAQNWWDWGEAIDYPIIMSYTQDVGLFSDFLQFAIGTQPNAILGIGFLWPDMEPEAFWEKEAVRKKGGAGICYFDFESLDTLADVDKLKGNIVIIEDSLMKDTSRYCRVNNIFTDCPSAQLVETGQILINLGEDLEFAAFLLSLSLNTTQDFKRMELLRAEFLNKIKDDVAAFKSLDRAIFPLDNELIEPPSREITYDSLGWTDDSALVIENAEKTKKLKLKKVVYPYSMDHLAKAVFNAKKGKRQIIKTPDGVYIFKIKKVNNGGKKIKREKVKPELLPVYLSWTIKTKFNELYEKKEPNELGNYKR